MSIPSPPGGKTPTELLVDAIYRVDIEALQTLLDKGANPNIPDADGMTALHHAACIGSRPCIRILVASGKCNYLRQDDKGRYASHLAIEWAEDYAVARLLTKKRIQQADERGEPAWVSAPAPRAAIPQPARLAPSAQNDQSVAVAQPARGAGDIHGKKPPS